MAGDKYRPDVRQNAIAIANEPDPVEEALRFRREVAAEELRQFKQERVDGAWRARPRLHIKKLMQAQRRGVALAVPSARVLMDLMPLAYEMGRDNEPPTRGTENLEHEWDDDDE